MNYAKRVRLGEITVNNVNTLAQFIMYGQISLWECNNVPYEERVYHIGKYIRLLLKGSNYKENE